MSGGPLAKRLCDEADLCRNEGADDIANLLDEAAAFIGYGASHAVENSEQSPEAETASGHASQGDAEHRSDVREPESPSLTEALSAFEREYLPSGIVETPEWQTVTRLAAFTPAPWRFSATDEESHAVVAPVADYEGPWFTAIVSCADDATEDANARLMAAAPDLYEALDRYCNRYLVDEYEDAELCWDADHHHSIKALFDALAKARGAQ